MTDTFSTKKRSEIMRAIKSRGNASTEKKLIQLFKTNKISGWRRNSTILGRPDFAFPQRRIALFADGCFWHGHGCRNLTPAQNAEYWRKKIQRNMERDKEVTRTLKKQNWQVVRIWECEISRGDIGKLKRRL
ncbi:MAG: very short patch repair endonuclease [Anaerolineae bacterium UTCFX1]|jgi:DNA mismatch endonuclease (patch repair protein)|nr:MAG: very short patch repair endonuclease [Anaerolineae bacterium UTCFX1]